MTAEELAEQVSARPVPDTVLLDFTVTIGRRVGLRASPPSSVVSSCSW
jgi:hypothetical protein